MSGPGQISSTLNSAFASINPLAHRVNKGLHQVMQFAGEKIGAVDKTILPEEYNKLEERVDKLKSVYENMVKLSAYQIQPGAATQIRFSLYDVVHNVTETIGTDSIPTDKLKEISVNQQSGNQVIVAQYIQAGLAVGDTNSLGSALIKTGELHDKLGKVRFQMQNEVNEKMIKKLNSTLDTQFKQVYALRRQVNNARLNLDSIKSMARSASTSKVEEIGQEVTQAQEVFQKSVTEAVKAMKSLLNSNDALSCLADYHAALLKYFQSGFDLLSELAPEIDAMKAAQEALSEEEPIAHEE